MSFAGKSIGMEVKILFGKETSGRIKELLNTGRDVLIREYEMDGVWYIYCTRNIWSLPRKGWFVRAMLRPGRAFSSVYSKKIKGFAIGPADWALTSLRS